MPAKPLTPEQMADAKRLQAAFKAFQVRRRSDGEKSTQEELAELFGFGQSALSQYLTGKIPLNAEALLAFCGVMGLKPADISPSITAREGTFALKWINPGAAKAPVKAARPTAPAPIEPVAPHDQINAGLEWRRLVYERMASFPNKRARDAIVLMLRSIDEEVFVRKRTRHG